MYCPFCDHGISRWTGRKCYRCKGSAMLCDRCGEAMRAMSYAMPVDGRIYCRRCQLTEPKVAKLTCVERHQQARFLLDLLRRYYGNPLWLPALPDTFMVAHRVPVTPMSEEVAHSVRRLKPDMIAILRGEYTEARRA